MTLSDLLDARVIDGHGSTLGDVCDVRLVQDGPVLAGVTAALRVDALLVGGSKLAARLGYIHREVTAPALLSALVRHLGGPMLLVEWDDVAEWDHETHTVRLAPHARPHRFVASP
jgi:hypothetical protein